MIRNYLLTAWRNLLKNKTNALINIAGLSVAFTCAILLFLMIHFEFSFDQFQTNKEALYKTYNIAYEAGGDKKADAMSYPMGPTLKAECPSVLYTTALMNAGAGIRYKGKEVYKRITIVDEDFFNMFTFPIVAGNTSSPLGTLNNVVIDQETAIALFGKENPIGKAVEIKLGAQWKGLTVSSVLANVPDNSSVRYSVLARIEINPGYAEQKNSWDAQHHPVYAQLKPGATQAQAEKEMRQVMVRHRQTNEDIRMKNEGFRKDANGDYFALKLSPLGSIHFDEDLNSRSAINKTYLYTMMLIAIVVLIIACFNFINLNVARSFTRAKEVGIRKTLGADRRQIYLQLWLESLFLFIVSVFVAIGLSLLILDPFNRLFTEKLSLRTLFQPSLLLATLAATAIISFLAGGYPAWLVARFNAVEVLKGKVSVRRSSLLRSSLITFQFIMASALICGTLVIYRQFQHLRKAPLGFQQESVISLPVKRPENAHRYVNELRMKLASQPQVENITASSINIGIGEDRSQSRIALGFNYKDKGITTDLIDVDFDFLKVLGMKPSAGRDFSRDFPTDTSSLDNHVVVTESMAKQFGVKNPIGMTFYPDSGSAPWTIIGVIPDFHLYSMHETTRPISLQMQGFRPLDYILVKVKTSNPAVTMNMVQNAFRSLEPDNAVNGSFLSENTQRWYAKEERLANIFFSAAFIAILLSCLGLFAIVSLIMEQRRKEIGVRKVLGAGIPSIMGLLSKEFIRLVILGFAIASPVAWYFLNQWLQNFTYRSEFSWWILPLAGLLTLLIALVTVSVQTIRAAIANPVESLRSE